MSLYERVPQIDLAPAFSDPPYAPFVVRDYVRLLGDLFYFPQAARDYARRFARSARSESGPPQAPTPRAWGAWLRDNPVQADFVWMVALLGVLLILVLVNGAGIAAALLARTPAPLGAMGWALLLAIVVFFMLLAIGAVGDQVGALAPFALPAALAIGLTWLACTAAPLLGMRDGFAGVMLLAALAALAFGVAVAAFFATASAGFNGLWTHAVIAVVVGTSLAFAIGIIGWPRGQETQTAAPLFTDLFGIWIMAMVAYLAGALRLDDYVLHAPNLGKSPTRETWLAIARVTPLPLPYLHDHITAWLDFEWQQGMDNCASLWSYTGQQASVRRAMHEVLRGDLAAPPAPEAGAKAGSGVALHVDPKRDAAAKRQAARNMAIVAHAADNPQRYPWGMLSYSEATMREAMRNVRGDMRGAPAEVTPLSVQRRIKRQQQRQSASVRRRAVPVPPDRPDEALVAAFGHLNRGNLADALVAFKLLPQEERAAEMVSLVQALHDLGLQENLMANELVELPKAPRKPFRPAAWQALADVKEIVRFAAVARHSLSPERRELAVDYAMRKLNAVRAATQPATPETRYLQQLAELWSEELETWLESAAPPDPLGRVENPFLFAEPLRAGRMFVNHTRELTAIRQAWQSGNLQPLLLHGPPQIGKTSLLYAAERVTPTAELAWFHLTHIDRKRMALAQALGAVEQAVRHTTMLSMASSAPRLIAPPAPAAGQDAAAETERVIRRLCALLQPRNLVLVLDDFDTAAAALESEGALPAFLNFIAHLFQTITNFSAVFVYERPPLDMDAPLFGTLADSVRTIVLGPLAAEDSARLLRPAKFPLYFTDPAAARVAEVTNGQPWLVQVLAHAIVERFNTQAAQRVGEPLICVEDVAAALEDEAFVQRTRLLGQNSAQRALP